MLSELPADEELTGGVGYSVVFFAGGGGEKPGGDTQGPLSPGAKEGDGANSAGKWHRPAWSWSLQAYNLVSVCIFVSVRLSEGREMLEEEEEEGRCQLGSGWRLCANAEVGSCGVLS